MVFKTPRFLAFIIEFYLLQSYRKKFAPLYVNLAAVLQMQRLLAIYL
jgi:hypothetical protein